MKSFNELENIKYIEELDRIFNRNYCYIFICFIYYLYGIIKYLIYLTNIQFRFSLIMKKFIVVTLLLLFNTSVSADNYRRALACEGKAASSYEDINSSCMQMQISSEKYACKARAFKELSYQSCNLAIQNNTRTLQFISEEISLVNKLYESNKLTRNEMLQKHNQLIEMLNEHQRYTMRQVKNIFDGLEAEYNDARNARLISNSIAILGGEITNYQKSNNFQSETYVINGKMINCTKSGTMTICN
jgi:hypothetical protein